MATNGQDVPHGDVHAVSGASATQDANAPVSTSNSTGKIDKAHSGNGPEKTEAEIYHERVGCGLFWAVGKFRPTNYMILCQRPLNGDLRKPNYNNDYIAPLFRDHLMPARKFLYSLPFANSIYKYVVEEVLGAHGMINYVDARTAWIDDIVKQAQWQGITQVVVIAAGYCTRAYRLKTGSTQFFEVDLPQVSQKKIDLVDAVIPDKQKFPRPEYVGADLATTPVAEALTTHGFDPSKPTLFTCEGILCYLPQGAVDGLMRQISALAAPGSRVCFDALHRDHMDGRVHNRGFSCGVEALKARGEPLLSSFECTPPGIQEYFQPLHWKLTELLSPKDMTEKRFKHLQWREKRPPMLPFESYVLLEKLEGASESKALPEITNITASTAPIAESAHEVAPTEAAPSAPEAAAA
ncbi:g6492 [Coccomyxa viridis]|uniref:G6492 protein n=1 Tax=Coccomyxa viridis TaxID=1274662 RepID=A0ABP1FY03_9CHLO